MGLPCLPDGRLLVTLGGINAVAIVAPGDAENPVQALIPTGWYPSAVATSANGRRVFVVNRKSPPGPNSQGCPPELAIYRGQPKPAAQRTSISISLQKAGLLEFPLPDERALAATTLQVAQNIGLPGGAERAAAEARMAEIRNTREARRLHHQGEPHLRSGARRSRSRQRRSAPRDPWRGAYRPTIIASRGSS